MIVSESFINSQKARDVEFTTDAGTQPVTAYSSYCCVGDRPLAANCATSGRSPTQQ